MDQFKTKNVVRKANSLKAHLILRSDKAEMSPEFVITDAAVFQMKVKIVKTQGGHHPLYDILLFVKFTKQRADDDFTYSIKFNSLELDITNKCFTSDDGTWHLISEVWNAKLVFEFNVAVDMELMPRAISFASLYDETELTDFELRGEVGSGEDGSVHMHRAVLAAASPVLRRMLGGAWRETANGCVDVTGTSKATLQHFKNYLYLQTLPESGLEQLLLLSMYYMMPELEQRCVDKLVLSVSAVNAYDMIEFAAKHKARRLLLAIIECINITEMRNQLAPERVSPHD